MTRVPPEAMRLLNGFRGFQLVVAACRLGLPDIVAAAPAGAEELAMRTQTSPDAMRRFLRGLATWGFFAEDADRRYSATVISDAFRSDRPGLRNVALMLSDEGYSTWGDLMYSLRTGGTAFEHLHGMSRWQALAQNPAAAAVFNAAMVELTNRVANEFVAAYDFASATTVMDVGGGTGTLLATVLRANPSLRGFLLDLPAGLAQATDAMRAAGVADRVQLVEASFFESLPARADVYLLKSIIHDWADEYAKQILASCRAGMVADARLVLLERVVPARIAGEDYELAAVMSDLHMMVLLGGRERTSAEYTALLAASGLRLTRTIELPSDFYALEAQLA